MDSSPVPFQWSLRSSFACWLMFLAVVVGLQFWHGAYRCDLAGDPDEAAHAVTSVMVRDYLTHDLGHNPMHYAEGYYARLPKVALGHYPPGFYVLAGLWLLPFVSLQSLLVLHAVLIALLALLAAWAGSRLLPLWLSLASALLVCLSAPFEKIAVLVMSDVLLAIACLLAAISFASYLDRPRVSAALAFGLAAAFAILTKGSGWMLAVLPPLAIVFTGQWRLLIKPSLWAAPVPVILLALPWQIISYRFTAGGMSELTPRQYFMAAVPFYAESAVSSFGWPLLVLLLASFILLLVRWVRGHKAGSLEACLWAMLLSGLAIALVVPSGTSSRYFIPIIVPMVLFAMVAGRDLALRWMSSCAAGGLVTALVLLSLIEGLANKQLMKQAHGFHECMQVVASAPGTTLVCADSRGEGALVADAAFSPTFRALPDFTLLRATKELATMDWLGRGYKLAFDDEAGLRAHLQKRGVRWVLLDDSVTATYRQPHFDQLKHALLDPNSGWTLVQTLPVASSELDQGSLLIFAPKT